MSMHHVALWLPIPLLFAMYPIRVNWQIWQKIRKDYWPWLYDYIAATSHCHSWQLVRFYLKSSDFKLFIRRKLDYSWIIDLETLASVKINQVQNQTNCLEIWIRIALLIYIVFQTVHILKHSNQGAFTIFPAIHSW